MKQIVDKFVSLERDIASEKGAFSLFALLLREDAEDKWDLVASAPWLDVNKKASLEYLVNQVDSRLDTQELLSLSRIILLEKGNPILKAIHETASVQHGITEMRDHTFFDLPIKHAYIITSNKDDSTMNLAPQPA